MNNEQQELLDEAFSKFLKYKIENLFDTRWDVIIEMNTSDNTKPYFATGRRLSQEEFINKCKTNPEFSETWGLKIEERELSLEERFNIRYPGGKFSVFQENYPNTHKRNDPNGLLDAFDIPTKLITITYNDTKLESYE
jgi:hypothetical protein